MPGRHHASIVVECASGLFWFDAGESCSHTAYVMGVDMPATQAVFISHIHMDHVGGLPNLFWTLAKISRRTPDAIERLSNRTIPVFLPDLRVWDGVFTILEDDDGKFNAPFAMGPRLYSDGVIYDKNGVRVMALRNAHLGLTEPPRSFSFRLETASRSIVYSGDVKGIEELTPILDNCDMLLMETGHHKVEDVCTYLRDSGKRPGRLVFTHHGRAILRDPAAELAKARDILGEAVLIADDRMCLEV
jgi:ribonuclease Z